MPFVQIDFTDAIHRALSTHWALDVPSNPRRLYGGEESAVYGIGQNAVRIGPAWRLTCEVEWCNRVALFAARQVPQAVAPIQTVSGSSVVSADNRPVSVWPLVKGAWPDPRVPGMAEQAAALLATLHLALSDMLPPQRPVPSFLEARFAHDSVYRERVLIDTDLDLWLAEFYRANPTRQVVHGDFYPGNVLADQGSLVAVLDWDDACVMALEAEVACAAMEWSGGMDASMTAMRGFVLQYERAAGHSIRLDDKDMAQFIRHRLRCEAKLFELRRKHGTNFDDEDHAYHARRLEKFWKLRP